MFPSWIVAQSTINNGIVNTITCQIIMNHDIILTGPVVPEQIFLIIGLIFGSVVVTLGLIGCAYFT
jgi:hypothetical protein